MTHDPARRVAAELRRHGLGAPARLLADAHRPIAPLLSNLGVAVGPLLGALVGSRGGSLERLIAEERALDLLVAELDAGDAADVEPR